MRVRADNTPQHSSGLVPPLPADTVSAPALALVIEDPSTFASPRAHRPLRFETSNVLDQVGIFALAQ